jgi:hypothetical protein
LQVESSHNYDSASYSQGTALEIACKLGLLETIDNLLLLHGASLIKDANAAPPADWIIYKVIREGLDLSVLQTLLLWLQNNYRGFSIF